MRGRYSALAVLALAAGAAGGIYLEKFYLGETSKAATTEAEVLYWVAPMDPNFQQPGPGKSPMGMDLIPVYAGQEAPSDSAEVTLSGAEINAIGVRTALARREDVSRTVETVGFIDYDAHLTSHVHTRVEGWIEVMNVRAEGDQVAKGDVLFEMFSPVIGSSSSDLIRALEAGNPRIIDGARNALRSQGMSDGQIAQIEKSRKQARNIEVLAPQEGVVISLDAAEGMYLQPGTRAVSLSDPSGVWLIADVFERDIARLSEDMQAVARFEHLPARTFEGRIDYIYPELDPQTRTLPVRLKFDNSDGVLRPGMFGKVSLVPGGERIALTVPSESIIRTGSAERVIVKTGTGTFKPRLVTTGLRDAFGEGGRTEVMQGLAPGEEVVASAQFLLDSESALSAGMMRMAPTEAAPAFGTGTLVALNAEGRMATIRHGALEALDWPAMTTDFALRADVPLEGLEPGLEVAFRAVRGADGLLGLTALGRDDGVAATGTGRVKAVTPDGKLALTHDPIPALEWPAMEMDMPVEGVDLNAVPLDTPVEFDLSEGEDGLFTVIAVRAEGMEVASLREAPKAAAPAAETAAPITVSGTIDAVDTAARRATITHAPITGIGMPGMTMDFAIDSSVDAEALPQGQDVALLFRRNADFSLTLVGIAQEAVQ